MPEIIYTLYIHIYMHKSYICISHIYICGGDDLVSRVYTYFIYIIYIHTQTHTYIWASPMAQR